MLWSTETVSVVMWIGVNQLRAVVDPVMVSTSQDKLVSNEAMTYKSELLPQCYCTPNIDEAEVLLDSGTIDRKKSS